MANPITQADAGSSLARLYDTIGSQSGGPSAEIEADRIILVHEMGSILASERFFTRGRTLSSGATAQSTDFIATITGLSNGPCRLASVFLAIETPGLAADLTQVTLSLLNNDATTFEHPIFAWDVATGVVVAARFALGGSAVANHLLLLNQLPYQEPLINGNSRGDQNTYDALRLRGTTAAFGAGTRTVQGLARVTSMSNPAGVDNTGSFGLPLYW